MIFVKELIIIYKFSFIFSPQTKISYVFCWKKCKILQMIKKICNNIIIAALQNNFEYYTFEKPKTKTSWFWNSFPPLKTTNNLKTIIIPNVRPFLKPIIFNVNVVKTLKTKNQIYMYVYLNCKTTRYLPFPLPMKKQNQILWNVSPGIHFAIN